MAKKKEMCSLENHEPGAGIVLMKLEELHSFEGHPFKVERNQELFELRCSIEKEGVLVPLLVRKIHMVMDMKSYPGTDGKKQHYGQSLQKCRLLFGNWMMTSRL